MSNNILEGCQREKMTQGEEKLLKLYQNDTNLAVVLCGSGTFT